MNATYFLLFFRKLSKKGCELQKVKLQNHHQFDNTLKLFVFILNKACVISSSLFIFLNMRNLFYLKQKIALHSYLFQVEKIDPSVLGRWTLKVSVLGRVSRLLWRRRGRSRFALTL